MSGKPIPVRALATNKRVRHDYEVLDTFEAGMELTGTEVKAARNGKVQLKDSYVDFRDGQ
ncbi:MAG TPA: SsrA-binding protein, partial [Thermoanaerobaculia bacterium]|nr:SsrA-binding protein [Thermoanaerobaculia bacterium]